MIIEEIKKDINFIKKHTLQPAWWKITKIFVLLGSLIIIFYIFGILKTMIWFSIILILGPGANIGDKTAVFEATHGTAPKYTGLDKVNPGALILSGCLMFDYLDWKEAANAIINALEKTIFSKIVTYDLARQIKGAREVKCSEFAQEVIKNI